MKNYYDKKDGYRETIQKGLTASGSFGRVVSGKKGTIEERTEMLKNEIQNADAIVIGAGAGISISTDISSRQYLFIRDCFLL